MQVKITFDELNVQENPNNTLVKILMLKGDKGDPGISGDYNGLINKPTKLSDFTNDGVFITNTANNLTNYYTKSESDVFLNDKANISSLSTVATSGSYNDLSNRPTIPTKTSQLTNDSGYITNTVNNLTNYYTTANTYSRSQIETRINVVATSVSDMQPVILYNNWSGANGTVTLSDSAANYTFLEIHFKSSDNVISSVRNYLASGKTTSLCVVGVNGNVPALYLKAASVTVSNETITFYHNVQADVTSTGNYVQSAQVIYIIRVIGYK